MKQTLNRTTTLGRSHNTYSSSFLEPSKNQQTLFSQIKTVVGEVVGLLSVFVVIYFLLYFGCILDDVCALYYNFGE